MNLSVRIQEQVLIKWRVYFSICFLGFCAELEEDPQYNKSGLISTEKRK